MKLRILVPLLAVACQSNPKLAVSEAPIATSAAPTDPPLETRARKEKLGIARDGLKKTKDALDGALESLRQMRFPDRFAADFAVSKVDLDSKSFAGVAGGELLDLFAGVGRIEEQRTQILELVADVDPIAEAQRSARQPKIEYAVLVGGPKDPSGNAYAVLAGLTKPIDVSDPAKIKLPTELVVTDPFTNGNVQAPTYKGGSLDKPAAIYIAPKSTSALCPDATKQRLVRFAELSKRMRSEVDVQLRRVSTLLEKP